MKLDKIRDVLHLLISDFYASCSTSSLLFYYEYAYVYYGVFIAFILIYLISSFLLLLSFAFGYTLTATVKWRQLWISMNERFRLIYL